MVIVKIVVGILYLLCLPVITIMLGVIGLVGTPIGLVYSMAKKRRKLIYKFPVSFPNVNAEIV